MSRFIGGHEINASVSPLFGYLNSKVVSLEEALKEMTTEICGLENAIKEAKQQNYPKKHGLTMDEAAAIHLYTMEIGVNNVYRELNAALRSEDSSKIKKWFPYLKLFDNALDKLPGTEANLWRGVETTSHTEFEKNQELVWWNISSCSLAVNVIEKFLGANKSVVFMIETKNGKNISEYSSFTEEEVILRPGTKLRLKANSMKHPSGLCVVHLIDVSNKAFRKYY